MKNKPRLPSEDSVGFHDQIKPKVIAQQNIQRNTIAKGKSNENARESVHTNEGRYSIVHERLSSNARNSFAMNYQSPFKQQKEFGIMYRANPDPRNFAKKIDKKVSYFLIDRRLFP